MYKYTILPISDQSFTSNFRCKDINFFAPISDDIQIIETNLDVKYDETFDSCVKYDNGLLEYTLPKMILPFVDTFIEKYEIHKSDRIILMSLPHSEPYFYSKMYRTLKQHECLMGYDQVVHPSDIKSMVVYRMVDKYNVPSKKFKLLLDDYREFTFNDLIPNSTVGTYYENGGTYDNKIMFIPYIFSYLKPLYNTKYQPTDKTLNYTFGFTNFNGLRDEITRDFQSITRCIKDGEFTGALYYRDEWYNGSIPYDEYLDVISKTKYTTIIRSYENSVFSYRRFYESVAYNCLPILYKPTNIHFFYNIAIDELLGEYTQQNSYGLPFILGNDNLYEMYMEKLYNLVYEYIHNEKIFSTMENYLKKFLDNE